MRPPPLEPGDLTPRARRVALLLLLASLGCAALAQWQFALAHAALDRQYELFAAHRTAGLCLYGLLIAPVVALGRSTRDWHLPAWPTVRAGLVIVAFLVAGGIWLRVHRLDTLPPGLWIDEALNGVQAREIAAAGRPLAALPDEDLRTGLGAGFVDLAGLVFAITDPLDGPYALRATAAGIGVLGLLAAAALAFTLFGVRAALAATAWLAVSHYHLNYSRWGEMPLMSSVVETLLMLALAVGVRAGGRYAWAALPAAGALLGLGLYTYQTFRLFVLLAAVAALPWVIRRRAALAAHWRPLAAALGLALLLAAPILHYAATEAEKFGERAQGTVIFLRDDWREQLADSLPRTLLAFQLVGDDNPRHNLPFAPLLSFVPAMLAPIGLLMCATRWRDPACAVVVLWFACALVPGVVTLEAPHASRILDAIVPLALMIGVAVDRSVGIWLAALPARRVGVAVAGATAVAAAACMVRQEYRAYFVEREQRPEFVDGFFPWESAPARYLAAHAPDATVFLDPGTFWSPATRFVAWNYLNDLPPDVRVLRLAHDFPPRPAEGRDALLLLPRPYASVAEALRAAVPSAECVETRDRFGRIDLAACRVPAGAVPVATSYGLRGRYFRAGVAGGVPGGGEPDVVRRLPFSFVEYRLDEEPIGPFALAVWDGFIDLPVAGSYFFRLNPDRTSLTIGGQPILRSAGEQATGGANEGRADLPAGRLPIRITLEPGPQGPSFLWFVWEPPDHPVGFVPATALHPPVDESQPSG